MSIYHIYTETMDIELTSKHN